MGIPLGSQFDLVAGLPLDSRDVVADIAARDAIDSLVRYLGFTVYVIDQKKFYTLKDGLLNGDWVVVGDGAALTYGTTTQIPYVNVLGDDFLYSDNFIYDGTKLTVTHDVGIGIIGT